MKNPWEVHGIEHVSPSACNTFTVAPALWLLERVMKHKIGVGVAAHAGTAAELGISAGLLDPDKGLEECAGIAMGKFLALTALNIDSDKDAYRNRLPRMVEQGLNELRGYGPPTSVQGKVEYKAEGLMVPFVGYYDFLWENHGTIYDLKTTSKMPSAVKVAHARQISLYKHATSDNYQAIITYVTGGKDKTGAEKVTSLLVENTAEHVNALVGTALAMQKFLSQSDDPQELAQMIVPDYDNYYWNSPTARAHGFAVWGF